MSIDWQNFTPWASLLGGIAIGIAAGLLAARSGRILGVSGFVSGFFERDREWTARLALIAGLVLAPLVVGAFTAQPSAVPDVGWTAVIAGGLLVGFGTRLASGCTSGHGVCGLSRLSLRSAVATGAFMASAMATVFVVRHIA
ncbi:MAG: YeeE/YedE family protein [Siculibacillus sp.]|nr:YeeE/YedE family protein [Siculibacillus sp.]